jgi:uncharacterized protein
MIVGLKAPETDLHTSSGSGSGKWDRHHLQHAIDHAAHLLPAQGPITVFVHHNTLHAFEDLKFEEGVKQGAKIFGNHPYLPEEIYRERLSQGRIRLSDIREVLEEDLHDRSGQLIAGLSTRLKIRQAMLQYPFHEGPAEELRWFVAETDALRKIRPDAPLEGRTRLIEETRQWFMRELLSERDPKTGRHQRIPESLSGLVDRFGGSDVDNWNQEKWEAFTLQALWRVSCHGMQQVHLQPVEEKPSVRHRDLLLQLMGIDSDALVHEVLIRFCASFLDQGLAHWRLPAREAGFYSAFIQLYTQPMGPPNAWMANLPSELNRLKDLSLTAMDSIEESLIALGLPHSDWDHFISSTLLALRGWGGMICQVELRSDKVAHPIPTGSLVDFLAIRLLLDRLALQYLSEQIPALGGDLKTLRERIQSQLTHDHTPSVEQRAFPVFQLGQILGWSPAALQHMSYYQWSDLFTEIDSFNDLERRRILHFAFERRFRDQCLDAVSLHSAKPNATPASPRFQAVFCIDEREESFRRHLEENEPNCQTFGAAGFFSVAMYYRGASDAHFVPLCPVVIRPSHYISEEVVEDLVSVHQRRAKTRKAIGKASHGFHVGSRTVALGAVLTATVGVFASIPLLARVLFPRLTSRVRKMIGSIVQTPPKTRLKLERKAATPGIDHDHQGFSLDEMINIAERLLKDIGLINNFSPFLIIIGHGSNSLNNPHKSAYDCGACGGSAGGPNARALAQMLNDRRVREALKLRGITIPDSTLAVGGFHNTCNDSVTFLDIDRIPDHFREEFEAIDDIVDQTCSRNAHERSRRFLSAPLDMTFEQARTHVEGRAEDLAQTRPECGHATNAIAIVGRRERTRGLYLDRRAFLVSYDPSIDDENLTILTRIMGAIVPVCGGINLEYYFSYIDSPGWGCGSKLPHNITSLLGVMDGAASDLRTGLPWQMVEIHEPVRIMFILENKPDAILGMLDRNPGIAKIIQNNWVQLATLDPDSSQMHLYQDGKFVPHDPTIAKLPRVASSTDWYRGWRDHLEFASINQKAKLSTRS